MILLPELKLKKLLDGWLALLKSNWNNNTDKSKTFIYQLFYGNSLENYDFYTQAQKILLRSKDDPRILEIRTFFDRTRAHLPTIHITLPSTSPFGDGLGFDPNYGDIVWDDEEQTFLQNNTRTFSTRYNMIITSDNTFEVLLIYYAMQALMIANYESLDLNGLRNPKFSGQDMILRDDLVPNHIYARSTTIDVHYELTVPLLGASEFYTEIDFTGIPEPYYGQELGSENI